MAYEDLSGVVSRTVNPYDALLLECSNDPAQIQRQYELHRTKRNALYKAKLLDPNFSALDIDPVLHKLVNHHIYPAFEDTRHCLVFWARPPLHIRRLVQSIQARLHAVAPEDFWLMPPENLHMTAMEVAHSLTEAEIADRITHMAPMLEAITDFTFSHRAVLVNPMLGYDAAAVALSFVPAATPQSSYTYHNLRRDLHCLCDRTGVAVESRYVVPSAHLTLGRFVSQRDFERRVDGEQRIDSDRMKIWVSEIEDINRSLQSSYWIAEGQEYCPAGSWIVGHEQGLDYCKGTLWYGNGDRVRLGKGFEEVTNEGEAQRQHAS